MAVVATPVVLRQLLQMQREHEQLHEQNRMLATQLEMKHQDPVIIAVVAGVVRQAGFQRVHRAAAETLARMLETYILQLATETKGLAEVAGRSQPTFNDIDIVFDQRRIRASNLHDTLVRMRGMPALTIAQKEPGSLQLRRIRDYQHSTLLLGEGDVVLAPPYVPQFMPPFPPRHSFINTPMDPTVDKSEAQLQKQKCDQRRQIESALFKLMASGEDVNR